MKSARLVLMACFAGAVAGCVSSSGISNAPVTQATVRVEDNDYNQQSVMLHLGGTVTWQWVGMDYHSVTFKTLLTAAGDTVTSPIQPVGTYKYTFTSLGTFDYYCVVHGPGMGGTVIVVP